MYDIVSNLLMQPYVDWFQYEDKGQPLNSGPEPKRRFIPSKWEAKAVRGGSFLVFFWILGFRQDHRVLWDVRVLRVLGFGISGFSGLWV